MSASPIANTEELWAHVRALRDSLRRAGEDSAAARLEAAMTFSAHPGEVWPETLAALRRLVAQRPPGLDEPTALACIRYLETWP